MMRLNVFSKRKLNSTIFSALGVLIICVSLIVVALWANGNSSFTGLPEWIVLMMSLYLIFIFIRTLFHLTFSFIWLMNQKSLKNEIDENPFVSIIVPCYQEEAVIGEALKSLEILDYPNYEVIVVDDGSTDMTFTRAESLTSNISFRVIFQSNSGKAAALNRGIEEAKGEYILCMDADSKLDKDVLKVGIPHLINKPEVAAIAGCVKVIETKSYINTFQNLEYITALNFLKVAQSFLGIVTVIPGPIGLFRKSDLLSVGGYKTDTYAEDCDLTLRLLISGFKVFYEPKMIAETEAPDNFQSLIKQRYRWSRGIIQAIKLNSEWIYKPLFNFRNFFVIWYMIIESIIIPTCNYLFAVTAIVLALSSYNLWIIGHFFLQLLILDVIIVIYNLINLKFSFRLFIFGFVNRFTYGLALEIQRFFSIIDEIFGLPMSWGKLTRRGAK